MRPLRAWVSLLAVSSFSYFSLPGCGCEDWVKLVVLTGHRSEADCRKLGELSNTNADDLVFACPGEEVTICWTSNVSNIDLSPGFGTQPGSGIQYLKVTADTAIQAKPVGSCAGTEEAKVDVVTEPTPSTWTGTWATGCTSIGFEVHEEFVSKSILAVDITALWNPTLDTGNGTVTCTTPPFLDGFHQEEVFGFKIREPHVTEAFTRKLKAVGHWKFTWEAICPIGDKTCNPFANLPFDLTLVCG